MVPYVGILLLVLHSSEVDMFYCIKLENKKTLKVACQDHGELFDLSYGVVKAKLL